MEILKQMSTTEETVGGFKFYITPFPAFKAANLTGELASVLAPLLGSLIPLMQNAKGDKGFMDIDIDSIDEDQAAEAVLSCTSINGDKLEALIRKLLLGGHIVVEVSGEDGEPEAMKLDMDLANELFCGNIQDMFVLCFRVIKLNFNGFFKNLAALYGKRKSEAAKAPRVKL